MDRSSDAGRGEVIEDETAPVETTHDTLLGGRVRYEQPARGYRVGLEAPLLASFALEGPGRRPRLVADLGAGPGAIGLCVAASLPGASVVLVEADELHARLAASNIASNGLEARARVVHADVRDAEQQIARGSCDLVVSNPPWFERERGGGAPDPRRDAARALPRAALRTFLVAARNLMGRRARFAITFPATSLPWLFEELSALGLTPKRMRLLHPRRHQPANVVFVEARAAKPGGLEIQPPWFVRGEGEEYEADVRRILWGEALGPPP
jgi:tRNA1Val (adenine37-N6)-methyltransferase